jgi:hypothetical protein
MADLGSCERGAATRASEEDRLEGTVLAVVLDAHPAQLSVDELVRELTANPDDFGARDAINNAVRDLVGAGLLHRHDAFVFATRSAVRFHELEV